MKILIIEPHGSWPGPSEFSQQYCSTLIAAGHQVLLVTANGLVTAKGMDLPWRHVQALHSSTDQVAGNLEGKGYLAARLATVRVNWATMTLGLKLGRRDEFDAVHVLDSDPFTMALANLRYGRPSNLFITYRGYEFGTGAAPWRVRVYQIARRLIWRLTAGNVHMDAETEQAVRAAERSRAVMPGRIKVIPHPIWSQGKTEGLSRAEARKRIGVDYDGPLLLVFGHRPRMQKALDTVAVALRGMAKDFKIVIAGKENDTAADAAMLEMIRQAGWDDSVYMRLDYVPPELVEAYFAASDALLLSYRPGFLGASGVLAQACTYLKPVIASDGGDVGATVRRRGLGITFKAESAPDLARAIRQFLSTPQSARDQYAAALARLREERSWKNVAQMHVDMYTKYAGTRPG